MFHFAYRADGVLCAEDVDLRSIAAVHSTPTFVYAQATVERHFRVFNQAFTGHPHLICYSVKANSNRAILTLLGGLGSGADIVSSGELKRSMAAGIPPERIVFSGVGKTDEELVDALDAGILAFNVESEPELLALSRVARDRGVEAPVSLRVNPDIDAKTHPYIATGLDEAKFGVPIGAAEVLVANMASMSHVRLTGIDCHIGSQLTDIKPLLEALDSVISLVDRIRAGGHSIEHIDLGGGLGIPYATETPPHPEVLGQAILSRIQGRPETLILEPGRVIVGNAGILLTRVIYVKRTAKKTFVIVDAAMNDLLRPMLYQAHHEIWPVFGRPDAEELEVDVVGPVCETGDIFAKRRRMALPEPGDLLSIMSSGAYGFAMSSNYNSRPRAAEVLVSGEQFEAVRARERVEDLVRGERTPSWFSPMQGEASSEGGR
jgi:diaminopimelate decarboxylase